MSEEKEEDDEFWKSKYYFDLGDAVDDVTGALDAKATAAASAKLVGKTLFNAGLLAGKLGWSVIKEMPKRLPEQNARFAQRMLDEHPDMPEDKRARLEAIIAKHQERQGRTEA
jgi:hypothetical protein